jgi:hypothetical protein
MINIPDREKLLSSLVDAVNKTARIIATNNEISLLNKKQVINNLTVEIDNNGFYSINNTSQIIYKNITLLDSAIIIAQRYNKKQNNIINDVIELDKEYSKYCIEMIHYFRCYKRYKKSNDSQRMYILEDRYQLAYQNASMVKQKILRYRIR